MNIKNITILIFVILIIAISYFFFNNKKYIICNKNSSNEEIFSWDNRYVYQHKRLDIKIINETYKINKKDKNEIIGKRIEKPAIDWGALSGNYILIDRINGEVKTGNDIGDLNEKYINIYYPCSKVNKNEFIKKPKF